jgi:hypothetical protein
MHIRYERHVYESEVFMTDAELELSHCLYKGRGLDIADRSAELTTRLSSGTRIDRGGTHLNNAEVRLLASFIYRNFGYPFYPVLNGVCNVGDNLAMIALSRH